MITNSDSKRIEQAAKEYAKSLYSSEKSKPYVTTHGEQEVCCVTDFKAGCDYMEPILSQKDEQIKELVEGLEKVYYCLDWMQFPEQKRLAKQLLTKHKMQ